MVKVGSHWKIDEDKKHPGLTRNTGRTHFKKGMTPWNKGKEYPIKHEKQFKKGCIPWNKGMKGFNAGEDNPRWNGGTSRAYKTGYYSVEYKEWRKRVFERDNYTCKDCGATGYLTAHHIKSFAHHPDSRYNLDNGKTLCEPCHAKTDNYKGRAKRVLTHNT